MLLLTLMKSTRQLPHNLRNNLSLLSVKSASRFEDKTFGHFFPELILYIISKILYIISKIACMLCGGLKNEKNYFFKISLNFLKSYFYGY